jgi:hypothetical protein
MTEIEKLKELRQHHEREIVRIDNALDLLSQVVRMSRKADRQVEKLRAAVGGHAAASTDRKKKPKTKQQRNGSSDYARQKQMRESGTRPTDVVRGVIAKATKPLTREQLVDLTGFESMPSSGNGGSKGNANRLIGLALSHLVKTREVKVTPQGVIAGKNLQPPVNGNGAHA